MKGRLIAITAAAMAVGAFAPSGAAAGTYQFTNVEFETTPTNLAAPPGEPVRLRFLIDVSYSDSTAPFTGKLTGLAMDLDPSFQFIPTGFPQCDPALLAGTTVEQAEAICGTARVGSGDADLRGPMSNEFGDINIYNATPAGGIPRVVLHVRRTDNVTHLITGTIEASPGGQGGQRLDLDVPVLPGGFVFTDITFGIRAFNSAGASYIYGSCPGRWLFSYAVTLDTGDGGAGESNAPCTASSRTPKPPPNTIVVGDQTGTSQKGSELSVIVPGPGTVSMTGTPVPVAGKSALAATAAKTKKKKPKPRTLIAPTQATAAAAGTISLPITLTRAGLQLLVKKGKVVSPVSITFTPTGGTPSTTSATVTIQGPKPRKKPKKK